LGITGTSDFRQRAPAKGMGFLRSDEKSETIKFAVREFSGAFDVSYVGVAELSTGM
jgi:hypothetical protein